MHQRMGHLHFRALQRFCNLSGKTDSMCTPCVLAKSLCHPFKSRLPKADQLLYRVHSDVLGPNKTMTPSGKQYFVKFMDEYSKYCKIYLMANKPEVFEKFKDFLVEAERQTGQKLCVLKSDRGGGNIVCLLSWRLLLQTESLSNTVLLTLQNTTQLLSDTIKLSWSAHVPK